MGEVQWVKLYIEMFDKPKINKLRRLPAGNDILLFWVMLIAQAGKCNAGGMIYITERVPFTKEDLADEFGFEISTIELALKAFVEFGMIDLYDDGFISISNWEEYQNIDGMEKIREQTRKRVAKCREKKKLAECNATVTLCNGIEEEKEHKGYTAIQIVLEDGSLYSGYISTKSIEADGVSRLLIVAITIIVAAVTIILSIVFIRKKSKKKKNNKKSISVIKK